MLMKESKSEYFISGNRYRQSNSLFKTLLCKIAVVLAIVFVFITPVSLGYASSSTRRYGADGRRYEALSRNTPRIVYRGRYRYKSTEPASTVRQTLVGPNICGTKCCRGWTSGNTAMCITPICNPSCKNGGHCIKVNVCLCPSSYTGTDCSTKKSMTPSSIMKRKRGPRQTLIHVRYSDGDSTILDSASTCTQATCFNGGTCVDGSCICRSGYEGKKCEKVVVVKMSLDSVLPGEDAEAAPNFQVALKLCKALCVHGTCTVGAGPVCKCHRGYYGTMCENSQYGRRKPKSTLVADNVAAGIKYSNNLLRPVAAYTNKKLTRRIPVATPRISSSSSRTTSKYGKCYKTYRGDLCGLSYRKLMTAESCCRNGFGDGWGSECLPCRNVVFKPAGRITSSSRISIQHCPKGFKSVNGVCKDINECLTKRNLCSNGVCINSRGSFWCRCHRGYHQHPSRSMCLPDRVSQTRVTTGSHDYCYLALDRDGGCRRAGSAVKGDKAVCCCSVGLAWGPNCVRCPRRGSAEYNDLCPNGSGYFKSVSYVRTPKRPVQVPTATRYSPRPSIRPPTYQRTVRKGVSRVLPRYRPRTKKPTDRTTFNNYIYKPASRMVKISLTTSKPTLTSTTTTANLSQNLTQSTFDSSIATNGTTPSTSQPTSATSETPVSIATSSSSPIVQSVRTSLGTKSSTEFSSTISLSSDIVSSTTQTLNTSAHYYKVSESSLRSIATSGKSSQESVSTTLEPEFSKTTKNDSRTTKQASTATTTSTTTPSTPTTERTTTTTTTTSKTTTSVPPTTTNRPITTSKTIPTTTSTPSLRTTTTAITTASTTPPTTTFSSTTNSSTTQIPDVKSPNKKLPARKPDPRTLVITSSSTSTQRPSTTAAVVESVSRSTSTEAVTLDDEGFDMDSDYYDDVEILESAIDEVLLEEDAYDLDDIDAELDLDLHLQNLSAITSSIQTTTKSVQIVDTDEADVESDNQLIEPSILPVLNGEHERNIYEPTNEDLESTSHQEDACSPNPCQNEGECMVEDIQSFKCKCKEGYFGDFCETKDYCVPNPCKNGAKCETGMGFYYCVCTDGFIGKDCDQRISHCESNPCIHGTCEDNGEQYICTCLNGYTGTDCDEDIDECSSNVCDETSQCINTIGSFSCVCEDGFKLADDGRTCNDVNECLNSTICGKNGKCLNTEGSYQCECYIGYVLEDGICVDLVECDITDCGTVASCRNLPGSYECVCPNFGESYDVQTKSCLSPFTEAPKPEEIRKPCYSTPRFCNNKLSENVTQSECCCTIGRSWGDCESKQACPMVNSGEFEELCPVGRGLTSDENKFKVQDLNECELFGNEKICRNGKCTNSFGGYKCVCYKGYYYNPRIQACDDINECRMRPRNKCMRGFCVNKPGTFECKCPSGTMLRTDQFGSTCVGTQSRRRLPDFYRFRHRNRGHKPNQDGKTGKKDFCFNRILTNSMCAAQFPSKHTYEDCCCKMGTAWGSSCSKCPERTTEDYKFLCQNHAGPRMRAPLMRIAAAKEGIDDADDVGEFHEQECGIPGDCKNGKCLRTKDGYTCDCNEGFILDPDLMICSDVDECSDFQHVCLNGICVNQPGSFACICQPGFEPSNDDSTICQEIEPDSNSKTLNSIDSNEKIDWSAT